MGFRQTSFVQQTPSISMTRVPKLFGLVIPVIWALLKQFGVIRSIIAFAPVGGRSFSQPQDFMSRGQNAGDRRMEDTTRRQRIEIGKNVPKLKQAGAPLRCAFDGVTSAP